MTQAQDEDGRKRTVVRRSITISRSPKAVHGAFTNADFLSRFLKHLDPAKADSGDRHWLSGLFGGQGGQIGVKVVDQRLGELVHWRWEEDGEERGEGTVKFRPAPADRGTEVAVELRYDARGGAPRRWVERMLGTEPGQELLRDLFRLRQLVETGEIATTVGQPAAREMTGGVLVSAVGQPSGRAEQ